jgi:hypothetical protein
MPRFSELMKEERRPRGTAAENAAAKKPAETMEKVILFLPQHQLRWMDQIARECKARGGKQLWRGELIRGLIEGFINQDLDLTAVSSEREFSLRVNELLQSK